MLTISVLVYVLSHGCFRMGWMSKIIRSIETAALPRLFLSFLSHSCHGHELWRPSYVIFNWSLVQSPPTWISCLVDEKMRRGYAIDRKLNRNSSISLLMIRHVIGIYHVFWDSCSLIDDIPALRFFRLLEYLFPFWEVLFRGLFSSSWGFSSSFSSSSKASLT